MPMSRWFSLLNLSPQTTRAMLESLLDWRHEASAANTLRARVVAQLRGSVSMLRVLVGAAIEELRAQSAGSWWLMAFAGMLFFAVLPWTYSASLPRPDLPNVWARDQWELAHRFAGALPACFFWATVLTPKTRPSTVLGWLVSAVGAATVAQLLVVPAAWSHYATVGLLRPGFDPAASPLSQWISTCWWIAPGILLADRIRHEARRNAFLVRTALVVAVLWLLSAGRFAIFHGATWREIAQPTLASAWAGVFWFPVMIILAMTQLLVQLTPITILVWYLLARRQRSLLVKLR